MCCFNWMQANISVLEQKKVTLHKTVQSLEGYSESSERQQMKRAAACAGKLHTLNSREETCVGKSDSVLPNDETEVCMYPVSSSKPDSIGSPDPVPMKSTKPAFTTRKCVPTSHTDDESPGTKRARYMGVMMRTAFMPMGPF